MKKTKIEITPVNSDELELLRKISIQTFTETFAGHNTESNMQVYLTENLSSEKLNKEFNTPGSEFYFIKDDNEAIGYLKLNFGNAQTEPEYQSGVEIERIYVLKEFYGKGIGKFLLDKAIDITKKKQYPYIWLGVWENNLRAITFYKKHGFVAFDKHDFKLGDDVQTDILMKLNLK